MEWRNRVHFGDCRVTLRRLAAAGARVQMCVTSPPYYGLRSYLPEGSPDKAREIGQEATPELYVAALVDVFRAVREVLADDGTLWLNIGDTYAADSGARPPRKSGDCFGNHSVTYPAPLGVPAGLKPKDLIGIPWMLAFALRADGWYLRQEIVWHKPNPMPESVRDRCTKAHESLFLLAKSERYLFDAAAIAEPASDPRGPGNVRPVRALPGERGGHANANMRGSLHRIGAREQRNKRSVWTIPTRPYQRAHFATFPPALVEPCILAGSRAGDVVLDPFVGSGTTAEVAQRLGRAWVGCDLNEAYAPLQQERTRQPGLELYA